MQASPDTDSVFKFRNSGGFTILEMFVATIILAVVIVLLAQTLNFVSTAWSQGEKQVQRRESGRAILDFITPELQAAMLPVNPQDLKNLQFVVNPKALSDDYLNPSAIFWQAPIATDTRMGEIAEVGYFIQWEKPSPTAPPVPNLYRYFLEPVLEQGTKLSVDPDYIYNWTDKWDGATGDRMKSLLRNKSALFAENVVGFWVRCLDAKGEVIKTKADGSSFADQSYDSRKGYKWADGKKDASALPASVELSFALLDSQSARRLNDTLKDHLITLSRQVTNAADFTDKAMKQNELTPIRSDLRPYTTTIYLQNSQ